MFLRAPKKKFFACYQKSKIFECRRKISQKSLGFLEHQKPSVFESYDFSGSKNEVIENAKHFQSPKNRRF